MGHVPEQTTTKERRARERDIVAAAFILLVAPALTQGLWCLLWGSHTASNPKALMAASLLVIVSAIVSWWISTRAVPAQESGSKKTSVTRVLSARHWQVGCVVALGASFVLGAGVVGTIAFASILLVVATGVGIGLPWLIERLPRTWDHSARQRRVVALLWVLATFVAIVQHNQFSLFMVDSTLTKYSMAPGIEKLERHSCLTAYIRGAELVRGGSENVYDSSHWPESDPLQSSLQPDASHFEPFALDTYVYPPPFLVLPLIGISLGLDFHSIRTLWFAFNTLFFAVGLWMLAGWLKSVRARSRALLLAPVLAISLPFLFILQVGNVHLATMVSAMLALVAFERKREALGGALLAFAIITKISPALLVLVLLIQRRFRPLAWTAFFGVLYCGVAWLVLGSEPFEAFLSYQLPRLSSGEALAFLDDDTITIIGNYSPFALPFKLNLLGFDSGGWTTARWIGAAYTLIVIAAAVFVGRKGGGNRRWLACSWLALLTLSALQSPLASLQVTFTALWLLTLLADDVHTVRAAIGIGVMWGIVSTPLPERFVALAVSFSLFAILTLLTLLIWVVLKKHASAPKPPPAQPEHA